MSSVLDQIKLQYKNGSMNLKLIMINVGVFIVTLLLMVIFKLLSINFSILNFVQAPSDFGTLLIMPWTIITYSFVHSLGGIGHLFWNMVILYFAGNLFERHLGSRKLLSVYLLGGIAGFVLFTVGYNFLPALMTPNRNEVLIGASAAITAIFVAIGAYMPNHQIYIPFVNQGIKLIYIVAFFVLIDFIRLQSSIGVDNANTGGWLAHIGGAIYGFVYANQLRQGKNINKWFESLIDKMANLFKQSPNKLKVKYKKSSAASTTPPPRDDYEYNEDKVYTQEQIDAILDKISKSGYDSLTKKEKDFLFNQSNRN